MEMTRTEQLTLSLARSATGKVGDGQIVALIVAGLLAVVNLRAQVDLGLVVSAACLLGILSVFERRQLFAIVQRLEHVNDGAAGGVAAGQAT